ncbi:MULTISPECIES: tachylectin-related carbohydrate-binding protein [Streptomyces]|uniref:Tachylectin-related carbohydrate-binding protein n=1 Tax=Streptomyces glycanivorans TaxID=3033808 RepID=A0ABY9JA59_9ACTN|nr:MULTISPECIES: tachylectin-related carbohydrate-binding protein [unclassified Streptomyces]WSQ77949.1 tachylectin-related carbohydrate-binding protein [Streptomyces sp. NBC_01213]TXS17718.1 hypothetical protein EAO68_08185 [Streptomyces sp. wa22]WLQ64568.1 tachylectin-related carbohydrate-binding protein [Streptomyces sp. Alt3]WSQ85322.1 tachylectin-related carbohydrate-binding protein [Streptomyces sp. NBC_01212]WSR08586.1 tachylectin-related carbohydrate-binding protein [Streptomyces sp. N
MTSDMSRTAPRWIAAATAVAASFPLLVALPGTAHAAEAAACTTTGPTYAVDSAGKLLRADMPTPLTGGTLPTAGSIDTGWNVYGRMLAGQSARFYGIKSDGLYLSHRSSGTWDIHHKKISDNFGWLAKAEDRNQVTIDRDDRIWVLDNEGVLRTFSYDSAGEAWSADSGKILDQGWERYNLIVAADKGVVYGRSATDGRLYRSRYDFASQRWLERHVVESLADWNVYTKGITSVGGDTLMGVTAAGAAHYYRFDENIRDFPVYKKTVGASGWAAYTSVAGAPDACRIVNTHTPASVPAGLEEYSPAAIMQSSSGSLEIAYSDNIGHLVHGRIADPSDINSAKWATVSGNEAFSGRPTLAEHEDGRVVVTGHNLSGDIWQLNQKAKTSADWEPWLSLGGAMAQHPVTTKTATGRLVQFTTDTDGRPWYRIQQRPNVSFMAWMPLNGLGLSGPLTAAPARDGIQLFGRNAAGSMVTARFDEAGTLTSWTGLGDRTVTGTPAVVVYPGYRYRVFANDGQGNVVTTTQDTEGGAYSAWSTIAGVVAEGSPTAVVSPASGLTEIMVRDATGGVHNTGETTQGSGVWRTWDRVADGAAAEPTAFTYTNANGPRWGFTFRSASNATWIYELNANFSALATRSTGPSARFTGTELNAPPAG